MTTGSNNLYNPFFFLLPPLTNNPAIAPTLFPPSLKWNNKSAEQNGKTQDQQSQDVNKKNLNHIHVYILFLFSAILTSETYLFFLNVILHYSYLLNSLLTLLLNVFDHFIFPSPLPLPHLEKPWSYLVWFLVLISSLETIVLNNEGCSNESSQYHKSIKFTISWWDLVTYCGPPLQCCIDILTASSLLL